MPIVDVDDKQIASGMPGPVTKKLHQTFRGLAINLKRETKN